MQSKAQGIELKKNQFLLVEFDISLVGQEAQDQGSHPKVLLDNGNYILPIKPHHPILVKITNPFDSNH